MVETQQKLVPTMRFSGFDENWKIRALGELGEFKNGINKDKSEFGFGTPLINLMDVFGKQLVNSQMKLGAVNATQKEIQSYNLKKGDVIFIRSSVKRSGVGEAIVVMEDLSHTVFSGFLIRFRQPEVSVSEDFSRYCFWTERFRNNLVSLSTTSANTNINQESLKLAKVTFPGIEEQQKIANFLSSVDTKIEQLNKKKALWEQYKKGMMQKLFSQQIRFKDEQGKDYPDWGSNSIGELFVVSAGGDIEKSHSRITRDEIFCYPVYANSEKAQGFYSYSDQYRVAQNCITVSGRGTLGIAHARFEKFFPIVRLLVLIPKNECDLIFFEHAINALRIFNESTGVPQLTAPQLKKYRLDYAVPEEQQKIANFLSAIDRKIERVDTQIKHAQALKKGLLQQMFI